MTREVYETIIEIINHDVAEANLEDLKKLRNYLDIKINESDVEYMDTKSYYPILTKKLRDFLYENITSRGFKKVNFLMVMKEVTKIDSYDEIYVFDTIGIDRKLLLKKGSGCCIGEQSLTIFENALRCHGIERSKKIRVEEKEELNNFIKRECTKCKRR